VALGEVSPGGAALTTGLALGRTSRPRVGCPTPGGSRCGENARSHEGPRP